MEKIILYILLIFVIITSIFCGEWYRQSKCNTGTYCRYIINKNVQDDNGFNKLSCEEIPKKSDVKSITDGMITVMVLTSLIWVGWFFAWVADSSEHFGLITLMYLYILFIGGFSWTFIRNKCYKNKCYPSTTTMDNPEPIPCPNDKISQIRSAFNQYNKDAEANNSQPIDNLDDFIAANMEFLPPDALNSLQDTECCPTDEGVCKWTEDSFANVYNNSNSILEPFTETATTEPPISSGDLRYLHCKTGISKNTKREGIALYNSIIVIGIIFSGLMAGLILNVE